MNFNDILNSQINEAIDLKQDKKYFDLFVTIKAKKDCYLGLNIETYSDYDSHEADVDYLIIKVLEV